MARIRVKTDGFAKRIIRNGERSKRKALFRMGLAARNGLRNEIQRYRGKGKRPTSDPGDAPYDHGTYRRTALFKPVEKNGLIAGFSDFRSSNRNLVLAGATALAQDNLEFGATIRKKPVRKSRLNAFPTKLKGKYYPRRRKKRQVTNAFRIEPRPHVFKAREELFKGSKPNSVFFRKQWEYLIDRGYLK